MKNKQTYKTDIIFIRRDGVSIDQLVVVRFEHNDTLLRPDQVTNAFERAVTEWVKTTDNGRSAWEQSSEDLNIGDLLCGYYGSPTFNKELNPLLSEQGIRDWKVVCELTEGALESYDRVLAS
jgi:EAL domain-containing protein (putative c-di-GMP-specific phosphodiesterase class I)